MKNLTLSQVRDAQRFLARKKLPRATTEAHQAVVNELTKVEQFLTGDSITDCERTRLNSHLNLVDTSTPLDPRPLLNRIGVRWW